MVVKYILGICNKYMLDEKAAKKLQQFTKNLVSMDVYSDIKNSKERYFEYGFTRTNENGDVINGIIDLIYRHEGKLIILDYKTNSLEDSTPEDEIKKHRYDLQLEEYARAVEDRMDNWNCDRVLVFVDGGEVVRIY